MGIGEAVGEMSLLSGLKRTTSVIALAGANTLGVMKFDDLESCSERLAHRLRNCLAELALQRLGENQGLQQVKPVAAKQRDPTPPSIGCMDESAVARRASRVLETSAAPPCAGVYTPASGSFPSKARSPGSRFSSCKIRSPRPAPSATTPAEARAAAVARAAAASAAAARVASRGDTGESGLLLLLQRLASEASGNLCGANDTTISGLVRLLQARPFARGELIVAGGQVASFVGLVLRGVAETRDAPPPSARLGVLGAGSLFGARELFDGRKRSADVIGVAAGVVGTVSNRVLADALQANDALAHRFEPGVLVDGRVVKVTSAPHTRSSPLLLLVDRAAWYFLTMLHTSLDRYRSHASMSLTSRGPRGLPLPLQVGEVPSNDEHCHADQRQAMIMRLSADLKARIRGSFMMEEATQFPQLPIPPVDHSSCGGITLPPAHAISGQLSRPTRVPPGVSSGSEHSLSAASLHDCPSRKASG